MSIQIKEILNIKKQLNEGKIKPNSEEGTKQWLVLPIIEALGYNIRSTDVIPEYSLDVGVKKGEKVDYVLQVNNQPVALVECKDFNITLGEKHISQLYRYFTVSDVKVAILTNGNDFWFFTDSQKENIMDTSAYFKIRISDASEDEISKLELYAKDVIGDIEIPLIVQYENLKQACDELANGIYENNIPNWMVSAVIEKEHLYDISKPIVAEYIHNAVKELIDRMCSKKEEEVSRVEKEHDTESLGARMKKTMEENRKNMSNIKLDHQYVFNDYSDGDWRFHKLDYAIILGERYDDVTGKALLLNVVSQILKKKKATREDMLENPIFKGTYKIADTGEFRGACYIEEYKIYVATSYGISEIVKFIEKLLDFANIRYDEVKIAFKE